MILTDREIRLALANQQIEISPPRAEDAFASTSVDLTLGEPGEVWRALPGQPIRPFAPGYSYASLAGRKDPIASLDGYPLQPSAFLLAWTRETISLPITSRLAARVEGKSGLARLGLSMHLTAPTIHAGFRGQIQLEMINFGPHEIILNIGMPICQLIFEMTFGTAAMGYAGQFSGQIGGAQGTP